MITIFIPVEADRFFLCLLVPYFVCEMNLKIYEINPCPTCLKWGILFRIFSCWSTNIAKQLGAVHCSTKLRSSGLAISAVIRGAADGSLAN